MAEHINRRKLNRFLRVMKKHKFGDNKGGVESRLGHIEKGISQLLVKQDQQYGKLLSMDRQLSTDFASTRNELAGIEKDLKNIEKRYSELRNVPPLQLNRLKRGISRIKRIIQEAKSD